MALAPKIMPGAMPVLLPRMSIRKYNAPSNMDAKPDVTSTNELVHRFSLVGKIRFQK
ncbi:hypothetical protein D3C86_1907860 [compost metagenome]